MDSGIRLISNGTDNHMMIVDLRHLNITGKDAEDALGRAGITVNKNAIPFETRGPMQTSGIRIGTPAVTTRGMKQPEMETIAGLIVHVLQNPADEKIIAATKKKVFKLCEAFPLYHNMNKEVA
jgi:glycine hydroxymethyltransferase